MEKNNQSLKVYLDYLKYKQERKEYLKLTPMEQWDIDNIHLLIERLKNE